ncbi:MAG: glycosyltransferase [Burkholderiales bacterium]|nr:glycosyltransferase [Burkholderiales bacterium]
MIRLSICIPTYNYGEFIGQTLDSLLPQATSEVEVIVLDGGSTDNTTEKVAARQRNYPQLSYHHQDFRGGIDRDIEKVVSLAHGQYCWLFSADDIMAPGAIDKVLAAIESNCDIYLCEHDLCNLEMEPIGKYPPPFNGLSHSRLFDLVDSSQRAEYFRLARTSEAFFSFLAGPIFKKTVWDSPNIPDSFRSTCWIVAGHLLSMIPLGITVQYMGETLLSKREGNDSFSNGSMVNRHRITIEAFQHVANVVFGEHSEEAFHIRRVLQFDIPFRALLFSKLKAAEHPETEDINILNRIARMHYTDPSLSNRVKYLLYKMASPIFLKAAFGFKKWLRNTWA